MRFTTRILSLLAIAFAIIILTHCSKDESISLTEEGNIGFLFQAFDQESKIQRATLDVANFSFTSEKNVELTTEADAFQFINGTTVTGMVDLEFIELFTKSEILKYGIHTLTYDREILESDGEFKIDISQNGQRVKLKNGKFMNIKVPDSSLNDSMQLFNAMELSWGESDDTLSTELNAYIGQLSSLDWLNIDYYSRFDYDYTDVTVELPDTTYNYLNTRVFAIFHDQNSLIQLNYFNTQVKLPIGEKITVVALASQDSETFLYDEQSIIIIDDQPNVLLNPQPEDADAISDLLDRFNN